MEYSMGRTGGSNNSTLGAEIQDASVINKRGSDAILAAVVASSIVLLALIVSFIMAFKCCRRPLEIDDPPYRPRRIPTRTSNFLTNSTVWRSPTVKWLDQEVFIKRAQQRRPTLAFKHVLSSDAKTTASYFIKERKSGGDVLKSTNEDIEKLESQKSSSCRNEDNCVDLEDTKMTAQSLETSSGDTFLNRETSQSTNRSSSINVNAIDMDSKLASSGSSEEKLCNIIIIPPIVVWESPVIDPPQTTHLNPNG